MATLVCVLLCAAMAVCPAAPRDALMTRLLLYESALDGALLLSETRDDPGQCRRFQADSFEAVAGDFMLAGNPEAALTLPTAHNDDDRAAGKGWDLSDPGCAFAEIARFDYDGSKSMKLNLRAARAFLEQARAGDLMQMLAIYGDGSRGTHTILIRQDPGDGTLRWIDSNFHNRLIKGEKFGYVHADQQAALSDVAAWIAGDDGCGATLYRLREDIVYRGEE